VDGDGPDRQLSIQLEPEKMGGVYANFANVSFSDYEFTVTFAWIDHTVEEGDVRGKVAVRRIVRPLELDRRPGDLSDLGGEPFDRISGQEPRRARAAPRAP